MAQWYQLGRQLGRLDAGKLRHNQHVALRERQPWCGSLARQRAKRAFLTLFSATAAKAALPSSTRADAIAVRCYDSAPSVIFEPGLRGEAARTCVSDLRPTFTMPSRPCASTCVSVGCASVVRPVSDESGACGAGVLSGSAAASADMRPPKNEAKSCTTHPRE